MVAMASKGVAAGTSTPPAAARALPSGDDYRAALKLEADAQVARHGGKYADAAAMYRQAAGLRRSAGDRSDAAWDLAHAVECFAAVGMFEDGFRARDELVNTYPSEVTAISAAMRALREVDSVPAAKQ
jgi:tetratricopeptide (TPR) repeat protein